MKKTRLALAAFSCLALQMVAWATPVSDAQSLLSQGDATNALKVLERYLTQSPQDAEARFTKGLALVKLNRAEEAVKVFSDLTRDYPQLPEPYNNLAVLYAQQGDYEKARDALEAALATHPSYSTAHENLGDIYAALAGAAYNRALMLDGANQSVRSKLSLVNQLDGAGGAVSAKPTKPVVTPTAPVTPIAPPVAPPVTPPVAPTAPVAPPVVTPPPVAPPASTELNQAALEAISNSLYGWAAAWSAKDVDGYLGFYAPDFNPEDGLSRNAWEGQRRERIRKPSRIAVKAVNPEVVRLNNGRVRINFVQDYASDSIRDSVNKTIEMREVGGTWKITREFRR